MTAAQKLRELGEKLEGAQSQLVAVYDELGADYESDAAKQFELQLKNETNPDRTYDSWWVQNDRENVWKPVVGGKLPNDGQNMPWVITSYEESIQPAVRQAAELLTETRDASDTLATMSRDDLALLADIPTTLGKFMEVLVKASESMEYASNKIGLIRNNVRDSNWGGGGRDAYYDSLGPQEEAVKECQGYVEETAEATTALAALTVDVFEAFLSVRTKQLDAIQGLATTIFTTVNPGNWLNVAEKIHSRMVKVQTDHTKQFSKSLAAMAESAENLRVLEKAERIAGMTWPRPLSGIDGTWNGSPG